MIRSSARWLCLAAALAIAPVAAAESATRGLSYAYIRDGDHITMSGDAKDIARARSFKQSDGPVLWFRDAGQEYIVRDADTLAQLDAIWKPGRELDMAEAALDREEVVLDRKHDQLDSQREAIDERRETLADREAELAEQDTDDRSQAGRAERAKQRRELQQQRRTLDDERRALEPPMKELRAQLDVLHQKHAALAQKQQAASVKEDADMRVLLRRAVAAGTAKPAK